MKKLIIALFVIFVFLSSCGSPANSDMLAYQSSGAEISGILTTDAGSVRLDVTLENATENELSTGTRNAILRFNCTLGAHTVTVSNGEIFLSADGLSIPCSEHAGNAYVTLASFFAIDQETLYSAENGDDGALTLSFGDQNGNAVTVTLESVTKLPRKIALINSNYTYEIDSYRLTTDININEKIQ